MFEVLKILHVLGWAAWFGLSIAEASAGVQTRKQTEAVARQALARLWGRVGGIGVGAMGMAIFFGLALFAYELASYPEGGGAYMRDPGHRFVHLMLALGILAGVLTLLAAGARGKAIAALQQQDGAAFSGPYKRASMFSGLASVLILATIVLVYLHSA
jgi:hypothetical protein